MRSISRPLFLSFLTPHLLLGGTAMPTGAGIESVLGMLPALSSATSATQAP
jgi:hypothetical protein